MHGTSVTDMARRHPTPVGEARTLASDGSSVEDDDLGKEDHDWASTMEVLRDSSSTA